MIIRRFCGLELEGFIMAEAKPNKALRVGVIFRGRMFDEKLFPVPQNLTIGYFHEADIPIPIGDKKVPAQYNIFTYNKKEKKYYINYNAEEIKGTITIAGQAKKLDEIAGSRKEALIPVSDESRGRITIGDSVLLFLFVPSPHSFAKPMLPAAMRGGWFGTMDWLMATSFMVTFVLTTIALTVSAREAQFAPKSTIDKDFIAKYAKEEALKVEEMMKELQKGETKTEEAKVEEKVEDTKAEKNAKGAETQEQKVAKAQKAVEKKIDAATKKAEELLKLSMGASSTASIKAITNSGIGASSKGFMAVASDDGTGDNLNASNLSKVSKIDAGGGGKGGKVNVAAFGSDAKSMGSEGTAGDGKLTKTQEVGPTKKKSVINTGGTVTQTGTGYLDPAKISSSLKSSVWPKVQVCHARILGQEEVKGTITVSITIDANGKITAVNVMKERTTIDNKILINCLIQAIKSMDLGAKPENGSVTVVYPLNFGVD